MIRRFAKDMVIYALPMFLARAIGLLLLPIYTRQLGPTDFGFIEFVAATSTIFLLILPLEINQAVGRLLPESNSAERLKRIISTSLWFTFFVFALFGCLIYLFRFQLLELVNLSSSYAQYVALVCGYFLTLAMINLLQVQFRFTSQAKASVTINMTVVLTNVVLVMYFVTFDKLGIEQYFLSQIVSGVVGASIGLAIFARKFRLLPFSSGIDKPILSELLSYSLPIVLSSIGVVLSGSVDRLMVGSYIGLSELGYYGVALRLSAIVGLGFYVISSAMTPMVYREHEKAETKTLIAKVFQITTYFSIALLFVIIFYAQNIVILLAGNSFAKASNYVFYLVLSAIIANLYIFFLGMDITKKTKLLSKINLFSGMLGAVGSVVFIPLIGVWGAIISTLISNIFRLAGYVYFSQKMYSIPIKLELLFFLTGFLVILNVSQYFSFWW